MDEEEINAFFSTLLPEPPRQAERVKATKTRFVHYTSAESAIKILDTGKILLRNSTLMNDFSEVQHGLDCLFGALDSPLGDRLKATLDSVRPDLYKFFRRKLDEEINGILKETYILSLSEHDAPDDSNDTTDDYGRLSMWRAYAGRNGVAMVLNTGPFLRESNALNAYSTPVLYATPRSFLPHFEEIVSNLEGGMDVIEVAGWEWLLEALIIAFRFIVQSTKHPAFREEREWRVIYSPMLLLRSNELGHEQMTRVPTERLIINGVPQRVYAIPFVDYPDDGWTGATIPALLNSILIGPSQDAYAIQQAFITELIKHKVDDATNKVRITGIPLRT